MEISIINFNENIYCSSKPLSILSYFLMDDVGARSIKSLINWLKNDVYKSAVLNYSFIAKDNNKVKIYCFYDGCERKEHKTREKFEVEIPKLIRIATQWQDLYRRYRYIKISREKEGIFLTGREEK